MIIETSKLVKEFKRYKKQEGLAGSIKGLFKREYIRKTAVDHFDFKVEDGEFVGVIGQNGAGKTTLIKMLTGIIAPTSGEINVLGYYPNNLDNKMKQQYAIVMGQKSQLFFELTTEDTLKLYKEIYGIPDAKYKERRDYFVNLFNVEELMNVQVRTLSLGERMKMELIVALLHEPKVLFLDEPTIGLDAIASKQIRAFLKEINEQKGTTILLTSHYMEDIKQLCKRSVVINHGMKIYDGFTSVLFDKYQLYKKISFTCPEFEHHTSESFWDIISIPTGCNILEPKDDKLIIEVPKGKTASFLENLMKKCIPGDIIIEEEEVGNVVERIYAEGTCQN